MALSRLTALTQQAANGADLVVLPEMAATGYLFESPDAIAPHAEPADGVTFDALAPIARDARCWIVCGFSRARGRSSLQQRARDRSRARSSVLLPEDAALRRRQVMGRCGRLRLPHVPEHRGTGRSPSASAWISTTTDSSRGVATRLWADAIAFPTNWLDEGVNVWGYWAWRLKGIPSAIVAANTYGAEGEIQFVGRSAIIAGRELLAHGPAAGDSVLRATIPVTPRAAG